MNMQISRHWRLNAQRYRLQGVRYENGEDEPAKSPCPNYRFGTRTKSTGRKPKENAKGRQLGRTA